MKQLTTIISYIFHPLIIPTLAVWIIINLPVFPYTFLAPLASKFILTSVFINTYIIPILIMFLLKKLGLLHSFHLPEKRDRIYPMIFVASMLYITYFICSKWNLPVLLNSIIISFFYISIATIIITFFYKISLHLIGWGAFTAILLFILFKHSTPFVNLLPITIIISGIVAFARSTLNAHSKNEIIIGYFGGLASMIIFLLILL